MEQGRHSLTLLCWLWEGDQHWDPCSAAAECCGKGRHSRSPSCTALLQSRDQAGSLEGTGASRERGRCCSENQTCHHLRRARPARGRWHHRVNAANCLGMAPGASPAEAPHGHGEEQPSLHPLHPSNHTLSSGQNSDPPVPPPSVNQYILTSTPIPWGDAMVGAGEEELRANNSNRNRVEPFQLFICQMDSFPALFFFFFCYKNKEGGRGER